MNSDSIIAHRSPRFSGFHSWSVIAAMIVFTCLVIANLDGYHNEIMPYNKSFFVDEAQLQSINWTHGWPMYAMIRHSIEIPPGPLRSPPDTFSRWPFDEARIAHFYWKALLADLLFGVIVTAGTMLGMNRLTLKLHVQDNLTRSVMMGLILLLALGLTLMILHHSFWIYRYTLQGLTGFAIFIGVCLTLFAVVDFVTQIADKLQIDNPKID